MARGHEHTHEHGDEGGHTHEHDAMQECIEECLNCHAACTMTVQHCLAQGGELADVNVVGALLDCAEMCQVSANYMLRGSPYHALTCATCAEMCRVCEETCRAFGGDEQMAHCADVCASCADACARMAEMGSEEEEIEG
ncbi:MAG TPA: four-helix bundle copper-binding protein [Gemmatimonadaceae bacterium]|nr:four-helix bundle copper-binding protein [Gemmatimonadaceae bacterium]